MKKIILFLPILLFNIAFFSQDSIVIKDEFVIEETITLIEKSKLFANWKTMVIDTLNPTSLTIDLDGDKNLDKIGFYTGYMNGIIIFGNIQKKDAQIEFLFKTDFENSWFLKDKFQAVMIPIAKGQKIVNTATKKKIILTQNSTLIKKEDGSQLIITLLNNEWKIIKTK